MEEMSCVMTDAEPTISGERKSEIPARPNPPAKMAKDLTIGSLGNFLNSEGIKVGYDVIAKALSITIHGHKATVDNYQETARNIIMSSLIEHGYRKLGNLDDFLLNIAELNLHNPARAWVESREWDGKDRLQALYDTIKATNESAKEAFMFRWLITCVAAIFERNGISAAGMLVLQGSQGLGKTYWFRNLFEDLVRDQLFHDGVTLDPRNKDDVKNVNRNWVCELGELDGTFRKSDLAALKAFITRGVDVFRLPYGRKEKEMPRRTVLCGTVNNPYFLSDNTGNRRFWTIECLKIDSYHTIDMQQVWAQVYWNNYKMGEKWALSPTESVLVNEINEEHEMLDFAADKVSRFYDWGADAVNWTWKSAGEIAEEMGLVNVKHGDLTSIGMTITNMGGHKKRYGNKRLLSVPPRKYHAADYVAGYLPLT